MKARHTSTLEALADPKEAPHSLTTVRRDAWDAHGQRLSGLVQREAIPLRQHVEDDTWNNDILSEVFESRLRSTNVPLERAQIEDSESESEANLKGCVQDNAPIHLIDDGP